MEPTATTEEAIKAQEAVLPKKEFGFINLQEQMYADAIVYLNEHPEFVKMAIKNDPALPSQSGEAKVMLATYPSVIAIAAHKRAHELYKGSSFQKIQARAIAEAAHSRTGIDIHPGTKIGENFFIDHGTGDVIGETATIGNNTLLYHGVTLGAYATKDKAHRHPEIGSDCTISTGVKILGHVKVGNEVRISPQALIAGDDITIGNKAKIKAGARIMDGNYIGNDIIIGAGSVVAENTGEINQNIPPDSHVSRVDGKLHITSLKEQESLMGEFVKFVENTLGKTFQHGSVGL
jgi:serine O-acetyltransferase